MRYSNPNANLPEQFPKNLKKGLIISLAAVLLVLLTYITIAVKTLEGPEYQQVIEIEEIEETRQQIQKEEPPKPKIAQVIETEDEDVPDTVTIDVTELDVSDTAYIPTVEDDEEPVDFFVLESPPEPKEKVEPKYPDLARRGQVEGSVLVEVIIGYDGKVEKAKVVAAKPEGFFEDAALAAAKQWTFTPAKQRDKPVKVLYQIPVKFKLR
ncbi:energy transducer TonB [bacterium]|nr:MAG: energy transducer TonB [bacterium]